MKYRKRLLSVLLALALLAGCAAPASQTGSLLPGQVQTLRLAGGTDWGAPNPFLHQSRGPGQARMRLVYGSLLEKDETGDVGWLAESWRQSGSEYTFTLRAGAKFQDGTPLTAADVAFTIDYYRAHPPVSASLGAGDAFLVESCAVQDERTITITAARTDADTLSALGSFVILPRHIWEQVDDPYTYTGEGYLVGSGAYACTGYDAATGSYEFTAQNDFCAGTPAAQRVLFVPVSDPLLAFERGEIDITDMPADLAGRYRDDPSIGLVEKSDDMGTKLLVNFEKCPQLLDKSLREALYWALDRQAVVDKVFRGAGSVGSAGDVPPSSPYYAPGCVQYPYRPGKAKALLEPLGLELTMLCADSGDDLAIAELLANDLRAAGVAVTVQAYDSATRDQMVNAGDYELALVSNGGWGNNPPDYLRTVFSDTAKNKGGNPHNMGPIGYENAAITALADAQKAETDPDRRKELLAELQVEISREIPLVVVATRSSYSMYRKDVYDGWMKTYAYQQAEQNRLSYMLR